jgi:hypothetical protein
MNPSQLSITLFFSYFYISSSFLTVPHKSKQTAIVFLSETPENQNFATASEKFNARWNAMFERLKKYKEEHGNCLVPQRYEEDPQLGQWVSDQRRVATVDDKMKHERRDMLNSIGFVWRVREPYRTPILDKRWNDKFERLVHYKEKHGDCLVPKNYEEDPSLGWWVATQRRIYASNKLRSDRRSKLESLGFVWVAGQSLTAHEKQWENMFAKLEQYLRQHGNCAVPQYYKEDPSLGTWVMTQRKIRDELDSDRHSRLASIGFVWDAFDQQWEEMFEKLEDYRQAHGDCLVPFRYKNDPSLGIWVSTQRSGRDKLDPTRRERLESIGFVWFPFDDRWEDMFAKLKEYRRKHGDCLVPSQYKEDPSLGLWVMVQRRRHEHLTSEQISRLDSIGFVWRVRK